MRRLKYMVFEAISNVLQHVHAIMLHIGLRAVDNGCGFDPERVKLAGLRSLREHVAMVCAQIGIASVSGHTALNIFLQRALAG